jgi:hypothetical protein
MYIIPHQTFMGMYDGVLRLLQSEGHITNPNRRLLVALSKALQNDREDFPPQKELGVQIGVGAHQVGNILRALKKKELIQVISPDDAARHVYRQRNSYRFLYHKMYEPFVSMDKKALQKAIMDHYRAAGEPFPDYLDQ